MGTSTSLCGDPDVPLRETRDPATRNDTGGEIVLEEL